MSGNAYFDEIAGLKWCEPAGMGYLPLVDTPYDQAYFDKYVVMDGSYLGLSLTNARLSLVRKYIDEPRHVVDIGIGAGRFVREADCMGFDVNPVAVGMLIKQGKFLNPHIQRSTHATFWDSLEHISDIAAILDNITQYIFVSVPIFDNVAHVVRSKHFRPSEHCWYFTHDGFKRFIAAHGFNVIECNTMETDLGREDIGTYVCKRES